MKLSLSSRLAAFALFLPVLCIHASDTNCTEPQGFLLQQLPPNTDSLVSPAFSRPAAWSGGIASVAGSKVSVPGTSWLAGRFVPSVSQPDTHYLRVCSGTLSGAWFTVLSNDSSSVLLDSAGADLSQLLAGDRVEIVPYWTLGTLYPASQLGVSFSASSSALSRQTELFFYDQTGTGINRAASRTYYYYNKAWRRVGASATVSQDNVIVLPDAYFLQRNKALSTSLVQAGRVATGTLTTYVEGLVSAQDNLLALSFPVGVTLRASGLATNGVVAPSTVLGVPGDQLLCFDPSQTGINRKPTAAYYLFGGAWLRVGGDPSVDCSDSVVLPAGGGFIVRKAPASSTCIWNFNTLL